MRVDSKVAFEKLGRGPNGNVAGRVVFVAFGEFNGDEFEHPIDGKDFDFPRGSEQEVAKLEIPFVVKVVPLKIILTAKVHEQTAGQCCVQGHIHLDAPVGGGIGKKLDPNCASIPEG